MTPTPPPSRMDAARNGPRIPLVAVAAAALVVVLVVAAVVILLAGGDDGDETTTGGPAPTEADGGAAPEDEGASSGDQAFGPVTVEGEALVPFERGGDDDPAVGETAPTLVGEAPSGEGLTIDPGDGPMVIAFLAHWCPHCQAEVPRIVELADGTDEIEGVPFVAVATGTDPKAPNFPPAEWLDDEEWPAPVFLDDEQASAAAAYGLSSYPFLVAVDGDGAVVARSAGELGDDGLRDFFAQVAT